ncbi:uncharacterized protein LOC103153366 [Poecilia formosa]|uniref:uncharacterized protein LOC103153366 n=1 Tax=Poecilia formosa TaxID=48698 RepID=UPI0007B8CA5E|nr:PREDICTED: uncharacterized protein LOC103153366 [Poecilia formosa]
MSGLHSALLLLCCAGMIYLADSQTTPDETQASSQSPPKTPTSPASISNENPTTNQSSSQTTTSPPITPNKTTAATTAEPNTDPKCSYSVEKIKFGLKIKMTDSTPGYYTIYVAENGGSFETKGNFSFPSKNSNYDIKPLKPCTEYELKVTFIDSNGAEIPCNKTEDKTTTTGMTERDIKSISCPSGYFCYQSGWNIRSLLKENNKVSDVQFINGSYRIKPAYESICSELVLEFPQEKCTNITFTKTENVPFDFIDPNDVIQPKPTELPAKIEPELPPNCQNLSVEYKCSGINNDSYQY